MLNSEYGHVVSLGHLYHKYLEKGNSVSLFPIVVSLQTAWALCFMREMHKMRHQGFRCCGALSVFGPFQISLEFFNISFSTYEGLRSKDMSILSTKLEYQCIPNQSVWLGLIHCVLTLKHICER